MLMFHRHLILETLVLATLATTAAAQAAGDYPIRPVPFTSVHFDDVFWTPRLETNRKVTLQANFTKCEETGRISNFAKAGGLMEGKFEGIRFNDSDVFKVVEGAAYSLALHEDPKLDAYLDDLIATFAAAQEDDGYLYTTRTINPDRPAPGAGKTRWSHLSHSHELYNVGHMYEAAVAHHQATGKRAFLDVAVKSANLIDRVFGPDKLIDVPGHQEIEIGLARLYRATGDDKYLKLAKFFLDARGDPDGRKKLYGDYCQDHKPVTQQSKAVGHAVRAGYMYSGMADVAALTGNADYVAAIDRIWQDVVKHKLYITGGLGARRHGEAFDVAYKLPNKVAYNETCAAIANAMWNHRMFLLKGDGRCIDVLERVIYNGFLSGVSLSGDRFFYPNPLESDGVYKFNHGSTERQPWFGCSCCPTNIVRFIPSLPGYVYAQRDGELFVNLFVAGKATVAMKPTKVRLEQTTRYPWDGKVSIEVTPEKAAEFTVLVRIPGWARNEVVASDLYRFADRCDEPPTVRVAGESVELDLRRGYLPIRRTWSQGDVIEIDLPMPIRRVLCHEKVEANRGKVALQRGPIVYCLEGVDNDQRVLNVFLADDAELTAEHRSDLLGGVTILKGPAQEAHRAEGGKSLRTEPHKLVAVPYYAWAHRGTGEMAVWIARTKDAARPAPAPTVASMSKVEASYVGQQDTMSAVHDQILPQNSCDHEVPRFTWWDRKGSTEWVQYTFEKPTTVEAVEVYWFDDTGRGQCRVPKSWRVIYRYEDGWSAVRPTGKYGLEKDRFNVATFLPVKTTALRLVANLRPGFSGGVLEWRVRPAGGEK